MFNSPVSRRSCLTTFGLGLAAAAIGSVPTVARAAETRKRVLRIANITDVHVQPELGAADGLRQCLRHLHAQSDPVDLILNTGDAVMDCLAQDSARVKLIWDLWNSIWSRENKTPIRHVIGNHDIWGWNKKDSKTTGNEPNWGKMTAIVGYDLKSTYYSFDQANWHFIALDTVQPAADWYLGGLGAAQLDWLRKDLAVTDPDSNILIYSHIPIFSIAAMMAKDTITVDTIAIPGSKMLLDHLAVKDVLKSHPNIRLCISGHIHLVDRVDYLNTVYLCNGAVCGDYWKGKRNGECDAGYTLINLYDDGSFDHEYVLYGWKYRTA